MSFAPQFQAAGGFNFDTSARPGQPLHANIFRPPPSPSASSYNLAKSTGSLLSDISMSTAHHTGTAKRKRARTRESTPLDWHMNMDGAFDGREEERNREFRYTLAGQISTTPAAPPVGAENGLLEDSVYSDVDYRRALGPKTVLEAGSPIDVPADATTSAPISAGWSLFSLQTIGDMVGKVWEFCKKGAFRGFHAGGGQGYNVTGSTVTETTGKPWGLEPNTPMQPAEDTPMVQDPPTYFPQQSQTPCSPAYYELSTPESTPQPAAKRRQVSANNDELRNWVVVDEPSSYQPKRFAADVKAAAARPSNLARPRPGYYAQTSASTHRRITAPSQKFTGGTPTLPRTATRPSLRIPHTGSPNLPAREPASFASPRSSPVPRSTPSRIPVAVQPSPQQSYNPNPFAIPCATTTKTTATTATTAPTLKTTNSRPASRHAARKSLGSSHLRPASPSKTGTGAHRRNQSSASASATMGTAATAGSAATTASRRQSLLPKRPEDVQATTSPRLDAEARQLAQRKLAADRDADAKVDAFNARLLSMIRQGREALGTRVEVEMEMEDDAMVDFAGGADRVGGGGGWEDDD